MSKSLARDWEVFKVLCVSLPTERYGNRIV